MPGNDPNIRLDQYYADIQKIEEAFIANVKRLIAAKNIELEELSEFLTQYDFFEMLEELGYTTKASEFIEDWDEKVVRLLNLSHIKGVEQVAKVKLSNLDFLRKVELDKILRRGRDYAGDVQSELMKALIGGRTFDDIREAVLPRIQKEMVFYPAWFNSALNTAYSEYNSLGLQTVMEDIPEARFILQGPFDARTRPACRHALEIQDEHPQGFTKAEINKGVLGKYKTKEGEQVYDMTKRGGFNCRHYFEANTDSWETGKATVIKGGATESGKEI
ncbi:MAG: hypothetical protein H3C48_00760 [Chitinophagaceae bacterium]|nr:hypothetical protein [Chitinophagaceae bacterium]